MISSPIKWVGGKNQLLADLEGHLPNTFRTYFEPMFGGGALFFRLHQRRLLLNAVLSDTNEELMAAYTVIRDDVEGLIKTLLTLPFSDMSRNRYEEIRALTYKDPMWVAARFIYLNRLGFNGLYRVNRKGEFNVPYGTYTNPTVCYPDRLRTASVALKGALLSSVSFDDIVVTIASGDFVYFDPPYFPVSETAKFTSYTRGGFGDADQIQLAKVAHELKQRGVHVMLSNSDVPEVRSLYKGFHFHPIMARRSVNSVGSKRGRVPELIITSYE